VQPAPGFPCALCFQREEVHAQFGRYPRRENADACLTVIARSASDEAIQSLARGNMDCFASLAMTIKFAV
jgi:hypothetical protein